MLKRALDIFISLAVMILLLPVYLILAIMILIKMGRPIIFRQSRPGLKGVEFIFLKFRSMANKYDERDKLLSDRDRITPLGAWLRRTSLDELPSIFNVLKGDMSLVGPRPLLVEYLERYDAHQMKRHDVRPGVTGWAQVNGRNSLSWEEKFNLDVWYTENHTLLLDLKILLMTVGLVFSQRDINHPGSATMEAFQGGREKNEIIDSENST